MRIDTPQDLANWVRDRRGVLGWTQTELGRRIGSTRFWVADLEAGKPTLELGLVFKALRELNVIVDIRTPYQPARGSAPAQLSPRIDLDEIVDARADS